MRRSRLSNRYFRYVRGSVFACGLPGTDRPGHWRSTALCGAAAAALTGLIVLAGAHPAAGAGDSPTGSLTAVTTGSQSGLPVPRFVSLKSDRVNVRAGPTKDHEVVWVFARAGLPVEVTAEFENWRRIRDWEGAEGWVYHSLLSGRRSALVVQRKASDDLVPLYHAADQDSAVKARLEPGVLGLVKRCSGLRCRFVGEQFDGFIAQERLWGVYPGEKID